MKLITQDARAEWRRVAKNILSEPDKWGKGRCADQENIIRMLDALDAAENKTEPPNPIAQEERTEWRRVATSLLSEYGHLSRGGEGMFLDQKRIIWLLNALEAAEYYKFLGMNTQCSEVVLKTNLGSVLTIQRPFVTVSAMDGRIAWFKLDDLIARGHGNHESEEWVAREEKKLNIKVGCYIVRKAVFSADDPVCARLIEMANAVKT